MSACPTAPSVTNSKAAGITDSNDTVTAYYECLSGFYMTGNQSITCHKAIGSWPAAPTCTVIQSDVYVYNDISADSWWAYLLAFFLVGLLLLLLAFVIWCCCWAPRTENNCCSRSCCRRDSRNTTPINEGIYRDNVFWHNPQSRVNQEGLMVSGYNDMSFKAKDQGQGQRFQNTPPVAGPTLRLVPVEVEKEEVTTNSQKNPREAPVYRTPKPAKDPSKETRMWMPHSHSVRDINTSTK